MNKEVENRFKELLVELVEVPYDVREAEILEILDTPRSCISKLCISIK